MEKIEKLKELKDLLENELITQEEFFNLKNEVLASKVSVSNSPTSEKHFKSVKIGSQEWMTENLSVSSFSNGDAISEAKTKEEWENANEKRMPAWCFYNNDPSMGEKYGKLYNWYAVNDDRGLVPNNWKIPSKDDWSQLLKEIEAPIDTNPGGTTDVYDKVKSSKGWVNNSYGDYNGTNKSGFNAIPSGARLCWEYDGNYYDEFTGEKRSAYWWSSHEESSIKGYYFLIVVSDQEYRNDGKKQYGLSVRCLKNS